VPFVVDRRRASLTHLPDHLASGCAALSGPPPLLLAALRCCSVAAGLYGSNGRSVAAGRRGYNSDDDGNRNATTQLAGHECVCLWEGWG